MINYERNNKVPWKYFEVFNVSSWMFAFRERLSAKEYNLSIQVNMVMHSLVSVSVTPHLSS